jgi:hypothetical protein
MVNGFGNGVPGDGALCANGQLVFLIGPDE